MSFPSSQRSNLRSASNSFAEINTSTLAMTIASSAIPPKVETEQITSQKLPSGAPKASSNYSVAVSKMTSALATIELAQEQQSELKPQSEPQRTKTPPIILVEYLQCCQCFESTMILAKLKRNECEYCGHSQCTICDEWVNMEWIADWLQQS